MTPVTILAPEMQDALRKEIAKVYRDAMKEARKDLLNYKEWLTFQEVGNLMNVSPGTLNKWIDTGLPYSKIDAKKYISRQKLNAFIDSHTV
ncbi:MAG: helix-turn-helix domain-containing protein [Aerococcus sp.]|nr:helix-turn-helix domain-containing protein [Aerococcus sp.]